MIRRIARRLLGRPATPPPRPAPPHADAGARSSPPPTPSAPAVEPVEEEEPPEVEVDHEGLRAWLDQGRSLLLLDIRELYEVRNGMLAGATWIPMNDVPRNLERIPRDRTVVVYCAAGVRSFGVAHWLRQQGLTDAWSLSGGAGAGVSAGLPWQPQGPG